MFFFLFLLRAQDVPPEVLRHRELKWLEMLKDWDKWINKRFKKVSQARLSAVVLRFFGLQGARRNNSLSGFKDNNDGVNTKTKHSDYSKCLN